MTTQESGKADEMNNILEEPAGELISHLVDKQSSKGLTEDELEVVQIAKEANPSYFAAVIDAMRVMKQRRDKYSGGDPYENFKILEHNMSIYFMHKYGHGIDRRDVFMFYHSQKYARLLVSGSKNFSDESAKDTRNDGGNYYFIDSGDMSND